MSPSCSRHRRNLATLVLAAAALFGCGGGGGGGATPASAPAPAPAPTPSFPVLLTSSAFSLAPIADPVDRTPVAGHQAGRVLLATGAAAPAGLTVEWLDASIPAAPRVLASAVTDAAGAFDIAGASSVAAPDQWLRVTLPDATRLRGFASGWTELSVGTEVALSEIVRLRGAGALSARALPMAELAVGQQSLGLLGQVKYAPGQNTPAAIKALTSFVAQFLPWNQYLDRLASATPDAGPGDVAAFLPFEATDATIQGTLTEAGASASMPVHFVCSLDPTPKWRECSLSVTNRGDLFEQLSVRPGGILLHTLSGTDPLSKLMNQIGDLPLLEFAPAIGTRVVYNNPQLVLDSDPTLHAAAKITRRTYPVAPVQALGGTVPAIEVVLDYEIAILNTATKQQADALVREHRWFSPLGGRVRIAAEALTRADGKVTPDNAALTLDGSGFDVTATLPLTGVIDPVALPLAHRYAAYSAPLNRIYVASESNGGQILELDVATLATLRSVATAGVPARLAVSADGSRIYAALAGGTVLELRSADLSEVRRFPLGVPEFGDQPFDLVRDMAVDPFDPERLLAVASSSRTTERGPARLFSAGSQVWDVAPKYSADVLGWSSVRDEFLVGSLSSPNSLYRFRAGATAPAELASLLRVDDIGVREAGGELLTPTGKVIDAFTLAPLRPLALPRFALRDCVRLDARSDVCEVAGFSANGVDATYVRFDNASGDFLGAYRPTTAPALRQCPIDPVTQLWTAAGAARLVPMADGRILVSNGDGDRRCGIQAWALRDYQK